ncbi:helix-turn-helix transcriptional regulator [Erwiniaceae bacterium BAC15a-03b]|uniref:Helix-turn-helix transcriptional regulator n=1 Tax=Winslowiella arboricola TaxID=2978220 RepID=A0A9J6PQ84_9GAMM|nr:helix-turn-helix transcriptional regulator [Winslowiella arboricola]MCU5775556.1 helix-turn-helix transcriptional regulator [Winslowiella arboricola]MCU5779594.1 helix-turn-helix transcriptional regulator [Winslowiella arboricola]
MSLIIDFTLTEKSNRLQLGAFLRQRRESLDPGRLGLPRMRNRRTPGLRREEVAQLADVGVTWYTWLEQGRDIKASAKTLAAIALALQCNETETGHLLRLAGYQHPTLTAAKACAKVSAHSQIMLDALDPLPAIIENQRFDVLAWNPAWCRLMGIDLSTIPAEERNCIWLAFNNQAWRNTMADWDEVMPHMVALFRAQMGEHLGDPAWEEMLARLMASSAEFRQTWQRYELKGFENRIKHFWRPEVGKMALRQNNWWSTPRNGDRLLVYVPDDEQSAAALAKLTA